MVCDIDDCRKRALRGVQLCGYHWPEWLDVSGTNYDDWKAAQMSDDKPMQIHGEPITAAMFSDAGDMVEEAALVGAVRVDVNVGIHTYGFGGPMMTPRDAMKLASSLIAAAADAMGNED